MKNSNKSSIPNFIPTNANYINFTKSNFKFSNFVCGDFYLILDSKIIIKDTNIFNYELCEFSENKPLKNIAKYKFGETPKTHILQNRPTNWVLIIEKPVNVQSDNPHICHQENELYYATKLYYYVNGKLIKAIEGQRRYTINRYGEILINQDINEIKNGQTFIKKRQLLIQKNGKFEVYEESEEQYKKQIENILKPQAINNKYLLEDNQKFYIYFYKKECISFYIIQDYCKNHGILNTLIPKFDDDIETINYKAEFEKSQKNDIAFLLYCFEKSGLNIFGEVGNYYQLKTKDCCGSAIYKLPINQYEKILENEYSFDKRIRLHNITKEEKNNYKCLIDKIYSNYNLPTDYSKYPKEFYENVISAKEQMKWLRDTIMPFINRNWENEKIFKREMNNIYNEIKQRLIMNGVIKTKWRSELELFILTQKLFPDAIYQYHSDWLNSQSLDIYIPSLKIGIEYQGKQHYEPVELFGGEESFERRKLLDERKRDLCKKNNIHLIEWSYEENILKISLEKKIQMIQTIEKGN